MMVHRTVCWLLYQDVKVKVVFAILHYMQWDSTFADLHSKLPVYVYFLNVLMGILVVLAAPIPSSWMFCDGRSWPARQWFKFFCMTPIYVMCLENCNPWLLGIEGFECAYCSLVPNDFLLHIFVASIKGCWLVRRSFVHRCAHFLFQMIPTTVLLFVFGSFTLYYS